MPLFCFVQNIGVLKLNLQVLLNQKEISGEDIDYILNNYPPQTRLSLLLEEENPGSLPFSRKVGGELDYALLTSSEGQTQWTWFTALILRQPYKLLHLEWTFLLLYESMNEMLMKFFLSIKTADCKLFIHNLQIYIFALFGRINWSQHDSKRK